MIQKFLILSFLVFLFALPSISQAENTLVFSDSSKPILQAMELSLKSNSLSYLYAMQSEKENSTYEEYKQSDTLKLKNPNTALFYAAVPGFLIHGAGHFYAGKSKTGIILLATGTVGGIMIVAGGIGAGLPEGSNNTGPVITILSGGFLFFGSWFYDMFKAPKIVKEQNEQIFYRGGK